jgi:hypothetical protein
MVIKQQRPTPMLGYMISMRLVGAGVAVVEAQEQRLLVPLEEAELPVGVEGVEEAGP